MFDSWRTALEALRATYRGAFDTLHYPAHPVRRAADVSVPAVSANEAFAAIAPLAAAERELAAAAEALLAPTALRAHPASTATGRRAVEDAADLLRAALAEAGRARSEALADPAVPLPGGAAVQHAARPLVDAFAAQPPSAAALEFLGLNLRRAKQAGGRVGAATREVLDSLLGVGAFDAQQHPQLPFIWAAPSEVGLPPADADGARADLTLRDGKTPLRATEIDYRLATLLRPLKATDVYGPNAHLVTGLDTLRSAPVKGSTVGGGGANSDSEDEFETVDRFETVDGGATFRKVSVRAPAGVDELNVRPALLAHSALVWRAAGVDVDAPLLAAVGEAPEVLADRLGEEANKEIAKLEKMSELDARMGAAAWRVMSGRRNPAGATDSPALKEEAQVTLLAAALGPDGVARGLARHARGAAGARLRGLKEVEGVRVKKGGLQPAPSPKWREAA